MGLVGDTWFTMAHASRVLGDRVPSWFRVLLSLNPDDVMPGMHSPVCS